MRYTVRYLCLYHSNDICMHMYSHTQKLEEKNLLICINACMRKKKCQMTLNVIVFQYCQVQLKFNVAESWVAEARSSCGPGCHFLYFDSLFGLCLAIVIDVSECLSVGKLHYNPATQAGRPSSAWLHKENIRSLCLVTPIYYLHNMNTFFFFFTILWFSV